MAESISYAHQLIENAIIALGKEGILPVMKFNKLAFDHNQKPGGPWIYAHYTSHNCTFLKTFIYELISQKMTPEKKFIPTECLDCYKVVVRPESLDELYRLKDIQKQMDFPSKCGIEKRPEVDALYGGYWYCIGLEHGLEMLDTVNFGLSGTNMKAFLKRGCTEFEADHGPSDKWTAKDGQEEIEKEAIDRVYFDNFKYPQTESDKRRIMEEWDIWAEALGPVYKPKHDYHTYGVKE